MWEGKRNIYKTCGFFISWANNIERTVQGVLAHSYNCLKVDTMKARSSRHSLSIMCEKTHKECDPFHAQTIIQA
jgi:hypothetical protein